MTKTCVRRFSIAFDSIRNFKQVKSNEGTSDADHRTSLDADAKELAEQVHELSESLKNMSKKMSV